MASVETQAIIFSSSSFALAARLSAGLEHRLRSRLEVFSPEADGSARFIAHRFVTSEAMSGDCGRPIMRGKGSMLSGFILGVRGA